MTQYTTLPRLSRPLSTAMSHDGEKGAFSADIPDEAIAEALAAVEKRSGHGSGEDAVEVEIGGVPPGSELDDIKQALAASQERTREAHRKLEQEHDARLRAAADLENYRKRAARERDDVLRYGNERLVKELLPVVDSLDRALTAGGDHPLVAGVELTRRMLEEALSRFGVKAFSAKGQPFDPRLHEALMSVATDAHPPGTVVDEQQRGFLMHDRLIRPAAVVVSVAPASDGSGAATEDEVDA